MSVPTSFAYHRTTERVMRWKSKPTPLGTTFFRKLVRIQLDVKGTWLLRSSPCMPGISSFQMQSSNRSSNPLTSELDSRHRNGLFHGLLSRLQRVGDAELAGQGFEVARIPVCTVYTLQRTALKSRLATQCEATDARAIFPLL